MSRGYRLEALTFEQALLMVRNGRASFDAFALATQPTWQRYAAYIARRWRGPAGVGQDDLEQELLMAAWSAIRTWDPKRQKPIHEYVTFMAIDKAKKWLHKQRNAKRRSDNAPGRFAVSFSALGCETAADEEWLMPPDLTTPSELLTARIEWELGAARIRALAADMPDRDREALEAVIECGGDLQAAKAEIQADPMRMLDMRVTETMVAATVKRAAAELTQRLLTDGGA